MKKLTKGFKLYFLCGIIALAISFVICTAITFACVNSIQPCPTPETITPSTPPDSPPNLEPILTTPESISLFVKETKTFEYSVTNLEDYTLTITISDQSVATINQDNKIVPNKVGTCKIITTINTTPNITKETTLTILDCVYEVDFVITDTNQNFLERLYTNTEYLLNINQNTLPSENPEISHTNLSEFTLLNISNNSYIFKFKIASPGTFSIRYVGPFIEKIESHVAYELPTNYLVNFSNSFDNQSINLYLYNTQFKSEANADNIYNCTSFDIIKESEFDDVKIENYDKNIISINENKITALSEGSCTITFTSNLSKVQKTYTIFVSKVTPSSITINDQNKSLYFSESIELNVNESYPFTVILNPIYAAHNLSFDYNSEFINFSNNQMTLVSNTTATISVLYNSNIIYSLTIMPASQISLEINLTNTTTTANFSDNTLTATLKENCFVQLTCLAYINNVLNSSQEFEIEIYNNKIIKHSDFEIYNGIINLEILAVGETRIDIINTKLNKTITIFVVINP